MDTPLKTTKRIVVQRLSGLRKIIGHMEVAPDAKYAPSFETLDFNTVEFVEDRPRYVLYQEVDTCPSTLL